MFYYTIILSFHVSLILPIYLSTLYINIAIQRNKKFTILQMLLSLAINGQQNIPFLSLSLYYDVTYQLNIQVKYIVQRYQFRAKNNSFMTPVIYVTVHST